jgi:hypothetical protein
LQKGGSGGPHSLSQRAAGERWRFLHFQPGSTHEFLVFTFLVIEEFRTGPAIRASPAYEVAEELGFLIRTADS